MNNEEGYQVYYYFLGTGSGRWCGHGEDYDVDPTYPATRGPYNQD